MLNETIAALKAGGERGGGRNMVAVDHARHAGHHPRTLCRGSRPAPATLPSSGFARRRGRDRKFCRGNDRPLRPHAGRGQAIDDLVGVKVLCRRAHVEKLEAGPKGIIIGFRNNSFANPTGLVRFISAGLGGQGAPRHEDRLHRRLRARQGSPERRKGDSPRAGGDSGEEERVRR